MKQKRHTILWAVTVFAVMLGMHCLTKVAMAHLDTLVFAERQSQLQEVVEQYFHGIDMITGQSWELALALRERISMEKPEDGQQLQTFLARENEVEHLKEQGYASIAIRSDGQYIDADGWHGAIGDISPLADCDERESYIYEQPFTGNLFNLFIYRLPKPLEVTENGSAYQISFIGVTRTMESMNQYFKCSAYGGDNSTYVLDQYGGKQYVDSSGFNIIKGHNVYSVLRKAAEEEGESFDDKLTELERTGIVYADTYLDGRQYFYVLRRMPNTDYVIVYINPADRVATSTESLVSLVIRVFSVVVVSVAAAILLVTLWIIIRNRKQLARETQAREKLAALNERLDQVNRELVKASQAKTEFLSNMSHDIRTPMNAIVGITRLMAHDRKDPEKMGTYIRKIQQSSQHLLSLINDVLDMSKIESSDVTLNTEPIDLGDQIGQVESIVRPQIEERGQHFIIGTRNIVHEHLLGDAVRLRQILINLLSNAVKYTPDGGNIRLDVEELFGKESDAGYTRIRISVTDSGYGMTKEFMEHIFEPFTRAENSTTNRVQGTGLGMAITKNIVDLAGGTISVESEVNKGSCFTVEVPLRIDPDVKTVLPVHVVLLATDDEEFAENVCAAFRESDATLLIARTEEEADRLLRENGAEVILLGSSLENGSVGHNVQRLRKNAGNAVLLYCCDYNEKEMLSAAPETGGADGVLSRPFFLSDLAAAIERVRSSGAPAEAEEGDSFLRGKRFLCAEDNSLNAEILQAVLDMNGAACVIYPDGQKIVEAFASVKPGEYDAILMDVQMPVMNGLDATREIRRSKNLLGRTIPIIAMTANAFSEDVQNCLDAGMDAHVSKPLDIDMLERTLKSILGGKNQLGGATARGQKMK